MFSFYRKFWKTLRNDLLVIDDSNDLGKMLTNLKTTYDETWLINTNVNGYLNDLFIDNLLLINKNNTIKLNSNINQTPGAGNYDPIHNNEGVSYTMRSRTNNDIVNNVPGPGTYQNVLKKSNAPEFS